MAILERLRRRFHFTSSVVGKGLDVSTGVVVFVALQRVGREFVLLQAAIKPIPNEYLKEDRVQEGSHFSNLIQEMIEEFELPAANVCVATHANLVAITFARLDKEITADVKKAVVKTELKKSVAQPQRDLFYDYIICENENSEQYKNLQIVALRKQDIQTMLEELKSTSFTPSILYVDSYAIIQALALLSPKTPTENQLIVVIHVEPKAILLIVLKKGEDLYFERQYIDIEKIEHFLYQLHASYKTAMKTGDENLITQMLETMDPSIAQAKFTLLEKIEDMLTVLYSLKSLQWQFVLSGSGALLPGLAEDIEKKLGFPTKVANPFQSITINNHLNKQILFQYAPAFMSACGLALRGLET